MSFLHARASGLGLLLLAAAAGCSKAPEEPAVSAPGPVDPALESYVLDSVPSDIESPTFVDFEGKVHLIGYAIEPKGVASPGSKVKLTLYWRSVAPLGPEWSLFTHLLSGGGRKFGNVDNEGPLRRLSGDRQALPPGSWTPGKIYVDQQEFEIPRDVQTPEITITTGIWRDQRLRLQTGDAGVDLVNSLRLAIISGPSDGQQRAIVTHVKTGIVLPVEARPKHPAT